MSRQNPIGFAFSTLIEVAAIVTIVAFLPRVDLRPSAAGAPTRAEAYASPMQPSRSDQSILPLTWTTLETTGASPPRETSYYQRPTPPAGATAPNGGSFATQSTSPAIEIPGADPRFVEDRLDRASQQLVNSVGSAVTHTANNLARYPTSTVVGTAGQSPPEITIADPVPSRRAAVAPSAAPSAKPRTRSTAAQTQPRPWLRY